MPYMRKIFLACAAAAVLFGACASVQFVQRDEDILALTELINRGDNEMLSSLSETPFLFDGETIMLKGDVQSLWRNLSDAGFTLQRPVVEKIEDLNEESYRVFGKSLDVEAYFGKYLPETAKLAYVGSEAYSVVFIVSGKKDGFPIIHGMKVY